MSFQDLEIKTEYRSQLDDVVRDFYNPVLRESVIYKRAVGFFSSSALLLLSKGIGGLIENGGSIQMVASPRLSKEDIEAINDGFHRREEVIKEALLRELEEPKGKFEEARLNLLSNLIAAGRLEIKIALLEENNNIGLFHEKLGLMQDKEGNTIAFSGSMNESENAFEINYEAIDVFTSWTKDEDRVKNKVKAFNSIWNNKEPNIIVKEFPEINNEILKKYKVNNVIDTHLDDLDCNNSIEESKYKVRLPEPKIPEHIEMRSYQLDAIEEWANKDYVGIFDMATGTGKTYTALAAISRIYKDLNKNLAVIIVCPYMHLVKQWTDDILDFGMKPIIGYSNSPQKKWREWLRNSVNSFNFGNQKHFCFVTTNSTFRSEYVQKLVKKLKGNVLLVIDEAHNFGAKNLSKTLLPNAPYRLALSATIDRYGDPEGTQKLYEYFGDKCIEYSLEDAIRNDMLTPYYYYPVIVSLNELELEKYLELTEDIRKLIHHDKDGNIKLSDQAKMLLIKRARIVAGAEEKVNKLVEVIQDYKNDKHILVYCGATTVSDIDYEEGNPERNEIRQVDLVTKVLGNSLNMRVSKFTSRESAKEREQIKANFAEGTHLQGLVAIRCLDEGVNIPSIKTAFILASSTNPKEYIQRRGRVLRKFPGKNYAVIYDFITLPFALDQIDNINPELIKNVQSLAKREITRMKDFAEIAENPFDSDSLISEIKRKFDIQEDLDMIDMEDDRYAY